MNIRREGRSMKIGRLLAGPSGLSWTAVILLMSYRH
jgi:hypothetical protein